MEGSLTSWSAGRSIYASNCNTTYDPADSPANVPIAADGANHSLSHSFTATVTSNTDNTDVTSVTGNMQTTGKLGTQGSDPSSISMSYSGKVTTTANKTASVCTLTDYSYIYTELDFAFTLTKPMWVNLSLTSPDNSSYSEVYIWQDTPSGSDPYVDMYNYKLKFAANGRTYLPAGNYSGYLDGYTYTKPAGTATGSGALKATFSTPGSRTAGPAGTAKPYVALGSARN